MKKAWNYFRKNHIYIFLPLLVLAAIVGLSPGSHLLQYVFLAIYSFSYYVDLRRGRTNIAERKTIARRGLTYRQMRNLNFLKKWEETRTAGITKFVFVFGGACFGFGLSLVFCFLALEYLKGTMDFIQKSPGNMFALIACGYLASFFTADVLYLILWFINEKKFVRLNAAAH